MNGQNDRSAMSAR